MFTDVEKARGTVLQTMFSSKMGDLICSARFKGVFMDFGRFRPVPFPPEFLERSGLT
ncbi:MAG: thioesterase family protein [Spirochaetia bacterium]|nr:thioesterase family protein [Spirochaetia bacterium]